MQCKIFEAYKFRAFHDFSLIHKKILSQKKQLMQYKNLMVVDNKSQKNILWKGNLRQFVKLIKIYIQQNICTVEYGLITCIIILRSEMHYQLWMLLSAFKIYFFIYSKQWMNWTIAPSSSEAILHYLLYRLKRLACGGPRALIKLGWLCSHMILISFFSRITALSRSCPSRFLSASTFISFNAMLSPKFWEQDQVGVCELKLSPILTL